MSIMSEISEELSMQPDEVAGTAPDTGDEVFDLAVSDGVSGAEANCKTDVLTPTDQSDGEFGALEEADDADSLLTARQRVDAVFTEVVADAPLAADLFGRNGDQDKGDGEGLETEVDPVATEATDEADEAAADDAGHPEPPDGPLPPDSGETGSPEEWENPRGARLVAPLRALDELSARTTDQTQKDFIDANTAALHEAAAAGVEVIDSTDVPEDEVEAQTAQPDVYNVVPSRSFTVANERAIAQELAARGDIEIPTSKRLIDTTYDELRERVWEQGPFVLARTDLERGKGKYLIDDRRQVDTLGRLLDVEDNYPLLENLVVTDFVPTPSDHYTSYKAISTPAGDLLAASLLYSPHEKDDYEHRLVTIDDPSATNDILRILFEYPESNAFLGAKLIGSYAGEGSEEIALMGSYAGQLRPGEAEILEAHGIDPAHPTMPDDIARQVGSLRPIARLAGLAASEDFIQSEITGRRLYLETNSGPGPNTYAICWLGDPAHPDGFKAMYRAAAQRLLRG